VPGTDETSRDDDSDYDDGGSELTATAVDISVSV
jgi:hypothetical protein